VCQRLATPPFATGLARRPSKDVAVAEAVGDAVALVVVDAEGADDTGAHADAQVASAAIKAMKRTTGSSYVQGVRNLMS